MALPLLNLVPTIPTKEILENGARSQFGMQHASSQKHLQFETTSFQPFRRHGRTEGFFGERREEDAGFFASERFAEGEEGGVAMLRDGGLRQEAVVGGIVRFVGAFDRSMVRHAVVDGGVSSQ